MALAVNSTNCWKEEIITNSQSLQKVVEERLAISKEVVFTLIMKSDPQKIKYRPMSLLWIYTWKIHIKILLSQIWKCIKRNYAISKWDLLT